MYDGYSRIFWGIFITTFHINLGPIKILPGFVGFLIIASGLEDLYGESKLESFKRVKSFAQITASLSLIGGVYYFFTQDNIEFFFINTIWTIVFALIQFTLYFKIIETSIEYFDIEEYKELKTLYTLKLRKYTVFMILNIIFISFSMIFNLEGYFATGAIIAVILNIYIMTMVYGMRDSFNEEDFIEEKVEE